MSYHSSDKPAPPWLAGIFLAVGLVFLGAGGWFAERRFTVMNSWPQVEAEVVESEVTSYEDSEGSTLYKAVFRFRYTVGGREYVTQTDNGYGTSFRSWMQAKVDRLTGQPSQAALQSRRPHRHRIQRRLQLRVLRHPAILYGHGPGLRAGGTGGLAPQRPAGPLPGLRPVHRARPDLLPQLQRATTFLLM